MNTRKREGWRRRRKRGETGGGEKKGGGGGKEASARDYERLLYEFTQFTLATNKCLLNTFLIKIMRIQ